MKFYVTTEGVQKLKRSFLNLKLFSIIDVPNILNEKGYSYNNIDDYGSFIVSKEINGLITNYTKSKRIRGIIYCNPNLNEDIINNLSETISNYKNITEFVLIDEYNLPKLQNLYTLFSEIIFFPSIKKVRLVECKSIKDKIDWKV